MLEDNFIGLNLSNLQTVQLQLVVAKKTILKYLNDPEADFSSLIFKKRPFKSKNP